MAISPYDHCCGSCADHRSRCCVRSVWQVVRSSRIDVSPRSSNTGPRFAVHNTTTNRDEILMKTLVTGGTGFVGANVVRALLKRGTEVRALVRPRSDTRNLDRLEVELVAGDLRDRGSLEAALDGCDRLYHVAAMYALWTENPREIYDSNVAGTVNILEAALQAGVQRIVYTSSVATIGVPKDGAPGTEQTPLPPEDLVSD